MPVSGEVLETKLRPRSCKYEGIQIVGLFRRCQVRGCGKFTSTFLMQAEKAAQATGRGWEKITGRDSRKDAKIAGIAAAATAAVVATSVRPFFNLAMQRRDVDAT